MKKSIFLILLLLSSANVNAACTDVVKIKELKPRVEGWIHIVAEGVNDIDLSNCGVNNDQGLLLNFNDNTGTKEGKQMMLSIIMAAFMAGKSMQFCSNGCDSQHASYSRLDLINELE